MVVVVVVVARDQPPVHQDETRRGKVAGVLVKDAEGAESKAVVAAAVTGVVVRDCIAAAVSSSAAVVAPTATKAQEEKYLAQRTRTHFVVALVVKAQHLVQALKLAAHRNVTHSQPLIGLRHAAYARQVFAERQARKVGKLERGQKGKGGRGRGPRERERAKGEVRQKARETRERERTDRPWSGDKRDRDRNRHWREESERVATRGTNTVKRLRTFLRLSGSCSLLLGTLRSSRWLAACPSFVLSIVPTDSDRSEQQVLSAFILLASIIPTRTDATKTHATQNTTA